MTDRLDVARGRDTVARWCALAEQRLEYLTELFETGRWRRFHSELSFLENIQEAKTAVAIWRDLSLHEASRHDFAAHIAWLGRTGPPLPTLRNSDARCPFPGRLPWQPHHLQQHGFAGIDQLFQRNAPRRPFALRGAVSLQRRHMHECSEAGAGVGRRRLDRAPAQIISEITAGIARGPRGNAGAIGPAQ